MSADDLLTQLRRNEARGPHYVSEQDAMPAPQDPKIRLIAFYLPQFHPIPENDLWWGRGFTEWTNVTRGLPRFMGHYQPRLPQDLGFYDLRNPEVMRQQAALARRHGIQGFCIYNYWFSGKRLLETPLDNLLAHPDIDMPFCLCWANENWTRRWDGRDDEILIAQRHSPEDDIALARSFETAFRDPRYIRIGDRPLLVIYRPGLLPNSLATVRRWRTHFTRAGLGDPYLLMVQAFGEWDPREHGFDAALEFPPHTLIRDVATINHRLPLIDPEFAGSVFEYDLLVRTAKEQTPTPYPLFRTVAPGWDNEARRPGIGTTFAFSTPDKYARWLGFCCRQAAADPDPGRRLVFVNAWNEWAEGAHLEPDRHHGYAYLDATARVLADLAKPAAPLHSEDAPAIAIVSHDAHFHGAQMVSLHLAQTMLRRFGVAVRVLLGDSGVLEDNFREAAPTEVIEGRFADLGAWRAAALRLKDHGVSAAICSTVVSAQAIRPIREAGIRVVSLVHELPSLMRRYGIVEAANVAAREADAIVFASSYVRDRFVGVAGPVAGEEIVRPQGILTLPHDEQHSLQLRAEWRARLGAEDEDPIILGCGGGDLRKGLDLWPILMLKVLARHPRALFVWVGSIEPEVLAWLRHDLDVAGLSERLRLVEPVEDMRPLYAAADVFLLTSREDPFPTVILWAMAHAVPVIAFQGGGGYSDLFEADELVPYLDVEAMSAAICRFLTNPASRRAFGQAAQNRAVRYFDFADYAFDLLRLAFPGLRKVSVVVPNFNYARYLRTRLESIWRQTYPIYEVIVLDDGSTDGSVELLEELEREFGRVLRIVRNPVNSGSISGQWARGVDLARGELVWLAEADDFADPHFLASVVDAFDDPAVVVSYCESRQVDEKGAVLAEHYLAYVEDIDPARWRKDYQCCGMDEIAEALAVKNTIPNVSAAVFRRDALARVLRDHLAEMAEYRNAADWVCYIRLLSMGSLAFVAEALNNHRRHRRSNTIGANDRRHLEEIIMVQELAASLTSVSQDKRRAARAWRLTVARQFGLDLADTEEGAADDMRILS